MSVPQNQSSLISAEDEAVLDEFHRWWNSWAEYTLTNCRCRLEWPWEEWAECLGRCSCSCSSCATQRYRGAEQCKRDQRELREQIMANAPDDLKATRATRDRDA